MIAPTSIKTTKYILELQKLSKNFPIVKTQTN